MTTIYTTEDCIRGMYDTLDGIVENNIGCIGILKISSLKQEYQTGDYQLFRIQEGFGAYPDKMGNAVYGEFCADGEHCRMERTQFIGIADESVTMYASQLEKKWKNE